MVLVDNTMDNIDLGPTISFIKTLKRILIYLLMNKSKTARVVGTNIAFQIYQ